MRAFLDLDSRKFILAPGVSAEVAALNFKRSANDALEIQFCRGRVVVELAGDATGVWEVKPTGEFDNGAVAGASAWIKTGAGEDTVYTFVFTWQTAPLDALFMVDGVVDNDVPLLTFMGAVRWTTAGKAVESVTAVVNVANNVIRDEDTIPDVPPIALGRYLDSGSQAIGSGVDNIAVVFDTAFPTGTTVVVVGNVVKPTSADSNLFATVRADSVSETGFTADLSADTDSANYKLAWVAIGLPA